MSASAAVLLVLVGSIAAACRSAAPSDAVVSRVGNVVGPTEAIERVPVRSFPIAGRLGAGRAPTVTVRLASEGEVSKPWPNDVLEGAAAGGGILALGVGAAVLSPMIASGAGVGGILLFPTVTILGIQNGADRSAVLDAIEDTSFPARLERQIAARIAEGRSGESASAPGDGAQIAIEVVLPGFGFVGYGGSDQLWFHCDADVRVIENGHEAFRETIFWRANKRSEGVPPPRYANLSEWADDDGRLARAALVEAAEVLAAIVARQLGCEP